MSLENARVLYKNFLKLGRTKWAADVLRGYPELKEEEKPPVPTKEELKENDAYVKKLEAKDGKKPKR